MFRQYVWTTTFHQPLVDLSDDRVSAVELDELLVLYGCINQAIANRSPH